MPAERAYRNGADVRSEDGSRFRLSEPHTQIRGTPSSERHAVGTGQGRML